MVIVGVPDKADPVQCLSGDDVLSSRARSFLSRPYAPVRGDVTHVYVLQREMALVDVSHQTGIGLIGSDDATTCSIVMLTDAARDRVAIAHLDDCSQISMFVERWFDLIGAETQATSLFLVGGYDDERHVSAPITTSILSYLANHANVFDISLLVTGQCNTTTNGSCLVPRVRGVAFDVSSRDVYPVEFPSERRGPLVHYRALGACHDLHVVVDCRQRRDAVEWVIGPYPRFPRHADDPSTLWLATKAPDHVVLESMSTSPNAEGPKFVPDMRARLLLLCRPAPLLTSLRSKAERVIL
ncbi:Protein N-terminal asparagine amidohydrolase [Plasmodiophora brassicae]